MEFSLYSLNVKAAFRRATIVDRSCININIHMYTIRIILFADDALVASILSHYTYTHILKPIDMMCPGFSYVLSSVTMPLSVRLTFTFFLFWICLWFWLNGIYLTKFQLKILKFLLFVHNRFERSFLFISFLYFFRFTVVRFIVRMYPTLF